MRRFKRKIKKIIPPRRKGGAARGCIVEIGRPMIPRSLKNPLPIRNCIVCNQTFAPYRSYQMKCTSAKCAEMQKTTPDWGVGTSTLGALTELIVSVDLMKKGYEVFRALSPHCSCDLLAMKQGVVLKVEVRTARRRFPGGIYYPKSKVIGVQIAAVTHDDGVIHYIPDLV